MADGAERRLREEGGSELVTLDVVNFGLLDSPPPLVQREKPFCLAVS